ncbi:MAG: hypothetical protein J6039_02240 [Alphaproteobacteria bacterium]|nr:hypothetical protein [Alphaproteobacteria bacterium]
MSGEEKLKICPEYCPFLKANNTFCELFKRPLQSHKGITEKTPECLDPAQRKSSYKSLGLSEKGRADMWHKAVLKHNEIELGKKREEEAVRKKFAAFLEEKFGSRPPLAGNMFLNNLLINLYMVLDNTERNIMMTLLNGRNGNSLIEALERAPKDESLLRNFRREMDEQYKTYQVEMQNQKTNVNYRQ